MTDAERLNTLHDELRCQCWGIFPDNLEALGYSLDRLCRIEPYDLKSDDFPDGAIVDLISINPTNTYADRHDGSILRVWHESFQSVVGSAPPYMGETIVERTDQAPSEDDDEAKMELDTETP